jgi:hypothetical protein
MHLNCFLAREEDLNRLALFVDLSGQNDQTYSIEIARLFHGACAEGDVVVILLMLSLVMTGSQIR